MQIVLNQEIVLFTEVIFGPSSNVTGAGIVKEATKKTKIYQCFPLYTMLLALGNPRYCFLTVHPPVSTVMLLPRYIFLTVISPVHNTPGPRQPQVQLCNSASLCSHTPRPEQFQVQLFNSDSLCK
jgi:hypothetical protein